MRIGRKANKEYVIGRPAWDSCEGTGETLGEFTKPFSITFQHSWLGRSVPNDCRLTNGTLIYKKG